MAIVNLGKSQPRITVADGGRIALLSHLKHLLRDTPKLVTQDNPGRSLTIDLGDTELESKKFIKQRKDRSDSDWYVCRVEHEQFLADCGPHNLEEVLNVFMQWAQGL